MAKPKYKIGTFITFANSLGAEESGKIESQIIRNQSVSYEVEGHINSVPENAVLKAFREIAVKKARAPKAAPKAAKKSAPKTAPAEAVQ